MSSAMTVGEDTGFNLSSFLQEKEPADPGTQSDSTIDVV
jgi:hypothetical protein